MPALPNQGLTLGYSIYLLVLMLYSGAASPAECWVDLYAEPGFKGAKLRVEGPKELADLTNLKEGNWNDEIDSLVVGPGAQVTVYRNKDFAVPEAPINHPDALKAWALKPEALRGSLQTFYPGHRIQHLAEFQLHSEISSLKVECVTLPSPSSSP